MTLCSMLESIAGKDTQAAGGLSADDISKVILGHLQEIPVLATAQLASAALTFEEIMSLQVDDIVLLDRRIDEPVELIANSRTVCYGWPVKSAGKYAVSITATAFGDTT